MAAITNAKLQDAITEILKDADVKSVTTKKVRTQLEAKFKTNLLTRKKEIEDIIMKLIADSQDAEEDDDEDDEEDEDEDEKTDTKKKGKGTDEALARKLQDEEEDDAPSRTRGAAKGGRKPAQKRKKGGDGEDDEFDAAAKPKAKRGGSGFTKEMRLSPELAAVMGAEKMARHEVVKKMWAVIGARDLKDPKDKRFTICDDELHSLFGVKRFRTFSMLKYLTKHFLTTA